jgi:hypothetical protein
VTDHRVWRSWNGSDVPVDVGADAAAVKDFPSLTGTPLDRTREVGGERQ